MVYEKQEGVPKFECTEYAGKKKEYAVLIPVLNEGAKILRELSRSKKYHVQNHADMVVCDGGSRDGCTNGEILKKFGVNTLLVKQDVVARGHSSGWESGGPCSAGTKES